MCPELLQLFSEVSDGRRDQGRVHPVAVVLALCAAAVAAGMRSFTAIAGWAADVPAELLTQLYGQCAEAPSKATIWRVATGADAGAEHDRGEQYHRGIQAQDSGGEGRCGEDHKEESARAATGDAGQPVAEPPEYTLDIGEVREYEHRGQEADGWPQLTHLGQRVGRPNDTERDGEPGGRYRHGRFRQPMGLDHGKDQDRGHQHQREGLGRRAGHRVKSRDTVTAILGPLGQARVGPPPVALRPGRGSRDGFRVPRKGTAAEHRTRSRIG